MFIIYQSGDYMFSKVCKKCSCNYITRKKDQMYCSKSCANSINTSKRKIEDESIFKCSLNEISSYILGLIYSDGCLSFDNHTRRYRITIAMNEKDLMERVRSLMTPNKKLYEYRHPNGRRETFSVISTNNQDIEYLINLGITERKSLTVKYPIIPVELYSHFIRGYFDGDGSVYKNVTSTHYKGIKKQYEYINVSFTTGSYSFAQELKSVLMMNKIRCNIVKDSRNNHQSWYVKIYEREAVKNLFYFMYKDATIYLSRKHIKFIEMI
jgi:intein/homing endonuclease